MTLSAKWDHGKWGQSYWDRLVCELTGAWTSQNSTWSGDVHIEVKLTGAWTSGDDSWAGTVYIINQVSGSVSENPDYWTGVINITEDQQSTVIEKPDLWAGEVWVTVNLPIYSAGGGWGWSYFGDREWEHHRKELEDAYDRWRYVAEGQAKEQRDGWSGSVKTAYVDPSRLQAQMEYMFGRPTYDIDWDEESFIEDLLL